MAEPLLSPVATSTTLDEPSLAGAETETETSSELLSELTSYLGNLGLGDPHLAKVVSLLQATHGEGAPQVMERDEDEDEAPEPVQPKRSPVSNGKPGRLDAPIENKTVTVFVTEEQPILLQAYQTFFEGQSSVQLLGASADTSAEALVEAATTLEPDVMLLGIKALHPSTVEKLETLRDASPTLGVVMLFAFYDTQGIKALREFSRDVSVGRAYLLKHTIDTVEQLTQAIYSVAEGRMIVDPTVMEELIKTGDAENGMLRDLSPRALEVLHWVARGFANEAIAGVLSRDVKTIERHINNIYTTLLSPDDDARHPRVRAALMYLRATGVLSTEQLLEE